MNYILTCDKATDNIYIINIDDYSIENVCLRLGESPIGPCGLDIKDNMLVVANKYSNSVTVLKLDELREEKNIYVGSNPNAVKIYNNSIYTSCEDSNCIAVHDIESGHIQYSLPLQNAYGLEIDYSKGLLFSSNLAKASIAVIDLKLNKEIFNIKTKFTPVKVYISKYRDVLYVIEYILGSDLEGYVSIYSSKDFKLIKSIKVGLAPNSIIEEKEFLYVSNSEEGSIGVINISQSTEEQKIFVGGMPKEILKKDDDIFILDYLGGNIMILNENTNKIKNIATLKEPSAMFSLKN